MKLPSKEGNKKPLSETKAAKINNRIHDSCIRDEDKPLLIAEISEAIKNWVLQSAFQSCDPCLAEVSSNYNSYNACVTSFQNCMQLPLDESVRKESCRVVLKLLHCSKAASLQLARAIVLVRHIASQDMTITQGAGKRVTPLVQQMPPPPKRREVAKSTVRQATPEELERWKRPIGVPTSNSDREIQTQSPSLPPAEIKDTSSLLLDALTSVLSEGDHFPWEEPPISLDETNNSPPLVTSKQNGSKSSCVSYFDWSDSQKPQLEKQLFYTRCPPSPLSKEPQESWSADQCEVLGLFGLCPSDLSESGDNY